MVKQLENNCLPRFEMLQKCSTIYGSNFECLKNALQLLAGISNAPDDLPFDHDADWNALIAQGRVFMREWC